MKKGAGIVPGSRLVISKGAEERSVSVRTSLDREISLSRYPDDRWMTIPHVDEVVIAIPSLNDAASAMFLDLIVLYCLAALMLLWPAQKRKA